MRYREKVFLLFATVLFISPIVFFFCLTPQCPDTTAAVVGILIGSILGVLTSDVIASLFSDD